jgi:tetratricopeptide (TPR) repeat protein
MMATTQDFGGLLFGMGGSGLEEYLTPAQTQGIQNQAMLQAAAALLQAGGPSARPVSLGQALGGALQAGQQGYSQAQQGAIGNLVARQKLDEAKRLGLYRQALAGGMVPPEGSAPSAPAQAGVQLTPQQQAIATPQPAPMNEQDMMYARAMRNYQIAFNAGQVEDATKFLEQAYKIKPNAEVPSDIRALEYVSGRKLQGTGQEGINALQGYRRAGAVNVDMGAGQKGFENEVNLKKMFSGEPIYKDFNDMQSAYKQVKSSLAQENPIGDVAAATKIMKLLDPGSVVRESELGISMAAAGKMDRLQNYVDNWAKGTKLTPTQRQDFQNLANELYAAAGQTYNMKRNEYADFGSKYNLDATKALGAPATIPSVMKNSGGLDAGGQQRKPLGSIFNP